MRTITPASRTSEQLWYALLTAAAAAMLGAILWAVVCTVPGYVWNSPRIAAAVALAQGQQLYPLPTAGAQLGWFYPPGFAVWYLPVTLLSNPTAILVAAALLNLMTILGAPTILLRIAGLSWKGTWIGAFTALALWAAHRPTAAALFWVHIDVPCVAFGIVASAAAWRWTVTRSALWLHLAALAITAAVFTKQIAAPLPIAIGAWLTLAAGSWRSAFRLLAWSSLYGITALSACIWRWGFEEIYTAFYLVSVRTPYQSADQFIGDLRTLLIWSPLWCGLVWLFLRPPAPATRNPASLDSLLIWVALAQLPLGLLAPLKVGGGLNSLHTLHYLIAYMALKAGRATDAGIDHSRPFRRNKLPVIWALCGAYGLVHVFAFNVDWHLYRGQETLLAEAQANRGKIYLPWNPLITLLTEHRILPFDNALYCLDVAGMHVPHEAVLGAIPRGALIILPEPSQSQVVLEYLRTQAQLSASPAQ